MAERGAEFQFAAHSVDELPPAGDQQRLDVLAVLAVCIANQQRAGFGAYLDVREVKCADCGASGFNTGWGFWRFSCGLEVMTDGEPSEPCGALGADASTEGAE